MTKQISKSAALKLWGELKSNLVATAASIEKIIENKAWEPLGYDSFTEAWSAQLEDVTLAVELRAHVVYQMFHDGLTEDEVAARVKGIGRDRASSLNRQRKNGVPASDASLTTVSEHQRRKPHAPDTLHVKLGITKLKRYKKVADKLDRTLEDIALEAIDAWFFQN